MAIDLILFYSRFLKLLFTKEKEYTPPNFDNGCGGYKGQGIYPNLLRGGKDSAAWTGSIPGRVCMNRKQSWEWSRGAGVPVGILSDWTNAHSHVSQILAWIIKQRSHYIKMQILKFSSFLGHTHVIDFWTHSKQKERTWETSEIQSILFYCGVGLHRIAWEGWWNQQVMDLYGRYQISKRNT